MVDGETHTMRVCVTDRGREIVYLGLYAALSTCPGRGSRVSVAGLGYCLGYCRLLEGWGALWHTGWPNWQVT